MYFKIDSSAQNNMWHQVRGGCITRSAKPDGEANSDGLTSG